MLLFLESTNPLKKSHKNNSMNMIPGTSAGPVFWSSFFHTVIQTAKKGRTAHCKQFSKSLGLLWQGKIYTDHAHISPLTTPPLLFKTFFAPTSYFPTKRPKFVLK